MAVDKEDVCCPKCKINVHNSDEALFCDGFCSTWFHASCVNIVSAQYQLISQLHDKISWICERCQARIDKLRIQVISNEDYLNLHEMVVGLVSVVKGVVNDNLALNSRIDDISECVSNFKLSKDHVYLRKQQAVVQTQPTNQSSKKPEITETQKIFLNKKAQDNQQPHDLGSEIKLSKNNKKEAVQSLLSKPNEKPNCQNEINIDKPILLNDVSEENSNYVSITDDFQDSSDKENDWKEIKKNKKGKLNNTQGPMKTFAKVVAENSSSTSTKSSDSSNRPRPTRNMTVVVGSASGNSSIIGTKRAWFHIGKVSKNTDEKAVLDFVKKEFSQEDAVVEKLESKGQNSSFRLGVDFAIKDKIMKGDVWPKNVTVKRFLFLRRQDNKVK